jgi:hypothetical protein
MLIDLIQDIALPVSMTTPVRFAPGEGCVAHRLHLGARTLRRHAVAFRQFPCEVNAS